MKNEEQKEIKTISDLDKEKAEFLEDIKQDFIKLIEIKFTDHFFISTQGRNDIRREQVLLFLLDFVNSVMESIELKINQK